MKRDPNYQGRTERQQQNNELIAFITITLLVMAGLYLLITKFVL